MTKMLDLKEKTAYKTIDPKKMFSISFYHMCSYFTIDLKKYPHFLLSISIYKIKRAGNVQGRIWKSNRRRIESCKSREHDI